MKKKNHNKSNHTERTKFFVYSMLKHHFDFNILNRNKYFESKMEPISIHLHLLIADVLLSELSIHMRFEND